MNAPDGRQQGPAEDNKQQQVGVVSSEGTRVVERPTDGLERPDPSELVEHPGKVMGTVSMIKLLLEEVRSAPLDAAGRIRVAEIHRRSITELDDGLAPELINELERITFALAG